jgi:hypothetical protein
MNDLTSINVVLDRSGSMASVRNETIHGFNTFVLQQRQLPGLATLSLAQFDDRYELVHDAVPLACVPPLTAATFVPRGNTALLDALGHTIQALDARLVQLPSARCPGRVLVAVLTDGAENSSRVFSERGVRELVQARRRERGWRFMFLGANVDAVAEAEKLGIAPDDATQFAASAAGTACAFDAMHRRVASVRGASR